MPGRILKIMVSEGEKVKKKQSLVIVEAMKMEHEIKSVLDGIVKKVNFQENQMVDTEEPIMELEQEK
jgi:biotin carboxyl carrier protein